MDMLYCSHVVKNTLRIRGSHFRRRTLFARRDDIERQKITCLPENVFYFVAICPSHQPGKEGRGGERKKKSFFFPFLCRNVRAKKEKVV